MVFPHFVPDIEVQVSLAGGATGWLVGVGGAGQAGQTGQVGVGGGGGGKVGQTGQEDVTFARPDSEL